MAALTHPYARYALVALSAVLSVIAVVLYAVDKAAARRGARRIPESVLHAVSIGGGWPGALLAQRLFRHKTRKRSFRTAFAATVVTHVAVSAWLLSGVR